MKTFVELVEEIKKSFDQEDNKILSAIEDNIELTSTATLPHAVGTYFVLDKVVYKVTTAIATGDTIEEGVNVTVADDIMTMIAALETENQTLTNRVKGNWSEGGKNLLPNNATTQTINGVTFTVNSDGTVTANGTATADARLDIYTNIDGSPDLVGKTVKLTGCPSGGGSGTYRIHVFRAESTDGSSGTPEDTGNGATFTWRNDGSGTKAVARVIVTSGQTVSDLLFKPMLSISSLNLSYDDYESYAKTNQQLTEDSVDWDNFSELGAVNLAQIKISSLTRDNVTYTVDATNGIITAVVSGTHTQDRMVVFNSDTTMYTKGGSGPWQAKETETALSPNGKYKIWGNPSPNNTRIGINSSLGMYIYINKEVSSGTFVFKPMITVASYNGKFVPFAKSNKELTEDVTPEYFDLSVRGDRCTILAQKNCKVGKQVFIWCAITYTQTTANAPVLTVPSGYCPKSVVGTNYGIPINILDGSSPSDHTVARYARVYSSGELDIYNVEQNKTYVISGCYIID